MMRKDWEIKKLGEVCEEIYAGGDKPALFSQEQTEDYKIPIYANGITNDGLYGFTKEATEDRECLTISARGTIGFVCVRNKPFVPIVRLIVLVPKQNVYIHYLKYYCQTLSISNTGSSIPQLTVPMIKTYSVMIPPLEEQKRIVKILDEKFAQLESLKANAQTNLQNAKDLFQSQLAKAFSNTTWEKKKVSEISENLDSKRIPITKNVRKTGQYPYYGASGIVDYVEDYIFDGKFLLVSEDGANLLARTYPIAFIAEGKFWVNNHAHILSFKDEITMKFVELFFSNLDISPYVTGMAQPKFNQASLNNIEIPLPSLSEQKRIVKELDTLSEKVKALCTIYEKQIADCDELKQAYLQKAFEGEL